MDPDRWPRGSYKITPVLPFVQMFPLDFFENWTAGRDQCKVVCGSRVFEKKKQTNLAVQKWAKWAQNMVFQGFLNILSLNFPGFGLKWYQLSSATSLWKFHTCKNSSSWDIDKKAIGQPECRIFKLAISQERNEEFTWFSVGLLRFVTGNIG